MPSVASVDAVPLNGPVSGRRLLAHSFLYETSIDWVSSFGSDAEDRLRATEIAGRFASLYHPGRFADGALENWPFQFGAAHSLQSVGHSISVDTGRRAGSRTLHVATEVRPVGGHTRFLLNWLVRDESADHALVLTDQRAAVPTFMLEAVAATGSGLHVMPESASILSRAAQLRTLAKSFDRVVLHSHPHDLVPIVALASVDLPPVAMFNHAHYDFNFGTTVADLVINTQAYFEDVSRQFRFARRTMVLHGLTSPRRMTTDPIDKTAAKARLGFSGSTPVVMTLGQQNFYQPTDEYDFFSNAAKLLRKLPDVHLVVIGVVGGNGSIADTLRIPKWLRTEPRCHFVGPVLDPEPYYCAADVFLESFPRPSGGGLVEAIAFGEAFPVPIFGDGENILRVNYWPSLDGIYRPRDEQDYLDHVTHVIRDLPGSREVAHQRRLALLQVDETFTKRLHDLNDAIDALKHQPAGIPTSAAMDTPDSRILAELMPPNFLIRVCQSIPRGPTRTRLLAGLTSLIRPNRRILLRRMAGYISTTLHDMRTRESKLVDPSAARASS